MSKDNSYRAYLEVRDHDGSTGYRATAEVLADPDLQARCIEKRELVRAIRILTRSSPVA